jgi:predicted ATPase
MRVFEPFRLDTVNLCLWRAEERVPLTPKAFDILRYLVERADRLVTPDEILETLWPETYVNPEGIRKYILEIRKVLGDRPKQPRFIQTLPKRGYQFVAKVTDERIPPSGARTDAANMVGRNTELAQLHDCFERALSGQRQVIFVTGEAGIGKTTLVDLFQQQAASHSKLRLARGQCIECFGGKEAYYPMLEALGSLIRNAEDGVLVQTLATQAPTWLARFPAIMKAEKRDALPLEIPGSTQGWMVREICEALEAVTEQAPLILILEDLHWGDASTLDFISAFARRREPSKLLLIATYRPLDVVLSKSPLKALKQDLLVHHLCHEIAMERLEEVDVAEYLAKTFAESNFPSGLASLIHHNSGGNALFMVAIVREIVKKGLITQDQGKWMLTTPLQNLYPGVPETLQQMLEIQFEQLSAEELRILQSCSVAGERFSVWEAAVMLETSPTWIEETCDKLAQRGQFIRFAGIHKTANEEDSAHYEFRHALYRQTLYSRLSSPHRSDLQRRLRSGLSAASVAGRWNLAPEIAPHFEAGRES